MQGESQLSELSLWFSGIPGYTGKARESQGKLDWFRMHLNKHIIIQELVIVKVVGAV